MSKSSAGLVTRLSPDLTGKERRQLRALAHPLKAVVQIGKEGVTHGLICSTEEALLTHELIKVRLNQGIGLTAAEAAEALTKATGAVLIQKIGRVLVLFKPHPEEPVIKL